MLDIESPEQEPELTAEGGDEKANLLGQLKGIRKKIAATDYKRDIDIPGYKGMLVARFRPYSISKTEKKAMTLRERSERDEPILLDAACDTLIDACEQIMVMKPTWDSPRPIDDEKAIKFDSTLVELLDLTPASKSAREVVKALFPTEQAIIAMSAEVSLWLRDVTKEVDEDSLGE